MTCATKWQHDILPHLRSGLYRMTKINDRKKTSTNIERIFRGLLVSYIYLGNFRGNR